MKVTKDAEIVNLVLLVLKGLKDALWRVRISVKFKASVSASRDFGEARTEIVSHLEIVTEKLI